MRAWEGVGGCGRVYYMRVWEGVYDGVGGCMMVYYIRVWEGV